MATRTIFANRIIKAVTIAAGASVSDAIYVPANLAGIEFPAEWTNASIKVQNSLTGEDGTFRDVYDDADTKIVITSTGVGTFKMLKPGDYAGLSVIRLVSVDTADSTVAVNQAAERILQLVFYKTN